MEFKYCNNCQANRGFKRDLGWGTFFAALFTFGVWLFFIPFYPKRCVVCGMELSDSQNNIRRATEKNREPRSIEELVFDLNNDDWMVRSDAVRSCSEIKSFRVVDPLISSLGDADSDIREEAAKALKKITGQDLGQDIENWKQWWGQNKPK